MPNDDRSSDDVRRFDSPRPIDALAAVWIEEYRQKRYLKPLGDRELDQRFGDIVSNLMVLGDDGKYHPQFHVRPGRIYAPIRGLDFLRMATDVWD